MKRALLIATIFACAPAYAQQTAVDHAAHHPAPVKAQAQGALVDGEVRKVDQETKKITLRHGPIPNLDMPAMSMVFQVKDPAMLEQVKAGDRVLFEAEKTGGVYVVTHIRKKD